VRQKKRIMGRMCAAAALVIAVTFCGVAALAPAASADAVVASAAARSTPAALADASAATRSTPATLADVTNPDLYIFCLNTLNFFGYPANDATTYACEVAAHPLHPGAIGVIVAVAQCGFLLRAAGVSIVVSGLACGAGAPPGFGEIQEWCDNSGGTACLNAWSGGPWVDDYTGGPETRDTNQDFVVVGENSSDTGYSEIAFIGSSSWSGGCIGDAYNNSGDADVSLDGCGSASGSGAGWGTQFEWGTSGCPSGEAWFYDAHWNGYLGPPAGAVNGSHFYLNKPSPVCFSVTLET
jgi:hypothetical protein